MRLKTVTTALVVFGLALMLLWPFVLGERPAATAPRRAQAEYGVRLLTYFGVTAVTWLLVAGCAVMMVRQARREFLEKERQNLQALIEGTLRDHERREP